MALATFGPTGYAAMPVAGTSATAKLPGAGTETALLVANMGPADAVVLIGASNAVTVTADTGIAVLAGQSLALTLPGTQSYLAAMAVNGGSFASLNLAVGS